MSDMWKTQSQINNERDSRISVREMLDGGCQFVSCMVRGHGKYDPDYRMAIVVSYSIDNKGCVDNYKCSQGYTWDWAYAVDYFGEPLTVYEYNRIRSQV